MKNRRMMFGVADELPDPNTPGLNFDAPCPYDLWPNMVVNAHSGAVYFPEHEGALSIKCAFDGREIYETDRGRYAVGDGAYLILNRGRRYASSIPEGRRVNSFTIFFQPDFADDVLRGLISSSTRLLDDPELQPTGSVHFFEHLYHHDNLLSPLLFRLRTITAHAQVERGWLEDQFHLLLEQLLNVHQEVYRDIARLPAVKQSTRVECYQRLQRARDFIEANYQQTLTLSEIADVACLSVHHFLRLFKHLFGITPYRYLTLKRLEAARRLLVTTDLPISAICFDIGFESPGSFSWLFRRKIGQTPEQYRHNGRANGAHRTRAAM